MLEANFRACASGPCGAEERVEIAMAYVERDDKNVCPSCGRWIGMGVPHEDGCEKITTTDAKRKERIAELRRGWKEQG
jgi:hypothetical protein